MPTDTEATDKKDQVPQTDVVDKSKKEEKKLHENVEIEKEKDKKDFQENFKKEKLDELKTIDEVEKAVEKYWKITDTYWLETVMWWLPWWDIVSSAFSTFYLLHQSWKLPKWKWLKLWDKIKIFWLEFVDVAGEWIGKIWGNVVWWAVWTAIWTIIWSPIPIIWNIIWWVAWWITWYKVWWELWKGIFDYFFKANKRSAEIFKKHCEKLRQEANNQNIEKTEYQKMLDNESKIEKKFQSNQA